MSGMYIQFEPGFWYPEPLQEVGTEAARFVSYMTGVPVDAGGNVEGPGYREPLADTIITLADQLYDLHGRDTTDLDRSLMPVLGHITDTFGSLTDPVEQRDNVGSSSGIV